MITELHLFDFDGTLFNSPEDTPENRRRYESEAGIPWIIDRKKAEELSKKLGRTIQPRNGWWGRIETLEPPLVPDPAPLEWFNDDVLNDLNKSKENEAVITLLLTGRLKHLKKNVEKICNVANVIDNRIHFYVMGEDGPNPFGQKPNNTFLWKTWIVEQFLKTNQTIRKMIVWEDRHEHVQKFENLHGKLVQEIVVNHIKST